MGLRRNPSLKVLKKRSPGARRAGDEAAGMMADAREQLKGW